MGAGGREGATGASAGVSYMTEVSATAASATGASAIGVSAAGTTVAPTLGLLELGTHWDSLGATWGHLGKGAPARCGHSWR